MEFYSFSEIGLASTSRMCFRQSLHITSMLNKRMKASWWPKVISLKIHVNQLHPNIVCSQCVIWGWLVCEEGWTTGLAQSTGPFISVTAHFTQYKNNIKKKEKTLPLCLADNITNSRVSHRILWDYSGWHLHYLGEFFRESIYTS